MYPRSRVSFADGAKIALIITGFSSAIELRRIYDSTESAQKSDIFIYSVGIKRLYSYPNSGQPTTAEHLTGRGLAF